MALLEPFRAARPKKAYVASVVVPPYDVVTTEEVAHSLRQQAHSFFRVTRPDVTLPRDRTEASEGERARVSWEQLLSAGVYEIDQTPALYAYTLTHQDGVQRAVVGAFSLAEYGSGGIARHELTRRDKEDDRTAHLQALGMQDEPVYLTYRARPDIDAVIDVVIAASAIFEHRDSDVVHRVFRVSEGEYPVLAAAFAQVPRLYIADGHHRVAAAHRVWKEGGAGADDRLLALAVPDREARILPYQRLLTLAAPSEATDGIAALLRQGALSPTSADATPTLGEVILVHASGRYGYHIARGEPRGAPVKADDLDVQRLQREVLDRVFGVRDPRTDERLQFFGGAGSDKRLVERVQADPRLVAFLVAPTSIETVMAIADAGGIMPPKSTWFFPKPLSGLLARPLLGR